MNYFHCRHFNIHQKNKFIFTEILILMKNEYFEIMLGKEIIFF